MCFVAALFRYETYSSGSLAVHRPSTTLLLLTLLATTILGALSPAGAADTLDAGKVVVVVLSQTDSFSVSQTRQLNQHLQDQATHQQPVVHLLHADFPEPGAWTVVPILPRLLTQHGHNTSWFFICEPRTRLNLKLLSQLLCRLDPNKPAWLGHALHDREPTIIHHFALLNNHQLKFQYPNFVTGFAINIALLKVLVSRLNNDDWPQTDFSIDVSHELSLFVWNEGRGTALNHSEQFCLKNNSNCASYPVPFTPCKEPVSIKSIFFAVKTCSKFHHTRVPVVLQTWARHVKHITLFSDSPDSSIPNIMDLGVPNTEQGHCIKTMAIVHHVAAKFNDDDELKWLVLADDDTIFSIARLQEFLSCHEPNSTSEVVLLALGERYGYQAQESHGYSYITGGGGTVLSREAVLLLASPGACECPAPTAPDDMFMGLCLARLNIPIIHSPFFHQARPIDYAPEYLSAQHPISFHKHWMIDPVKVYKKWFEEADSHIKPSESNINMHLEL